MIYYSPLISYYKSYRGAVPSGEKVTFRVVMPRSFGVTACRFILSQDGFYDERHEMTWEQTDGNSESWIYDFVSEEAALYFYHFEFDGGFGSCPIRRQNGGMSAVIGEGEQWQLTVFDRSFETPSFIKGGLIYQIFPDRFCNSGKKKTGVPSDRIIRSDYENLPVWQADEKGEVRNNDYFGGDFRGITSKLGYLSDLGVTCIYLNPICEAHSNHRYDTADYMKPDPLLGTMKDFTELCTKAEEKGIAVILDGVFSHTGADSVYFNKNGRYGKNTGAYNDEKSVYHRWYSFGKNRDDYLCWWNFRTLPEVKENDEAFTQFITGENGVIDFWLNAGAKGFRLDVADELPNEFLDNVRLAIKRHGSDFFLLGEVWEDATNKISGGGRRRFLLGKQLDAVMNYPFRNSVVDFVLTGRARDFMNEVVSVVDNYPPPAMNCCMNHLGTHDTERIITALSYPHCDRLTKKQQAELTEGGGVTEEGKTLLKAALAINFFLPGVPSVYYGDEAGLGGGRDPFNRRYFPWGKEDEEILTFTKELSALRKSLPVCTDGGFYPLSAELGCIAFLRYKQGQKRVAVISNMNGESIDYRLNPDMASMLPASGGEKTGEGVVTIPPKTSCIITD